MFVMSSYGFMRPDSFKFGNKHYKCMLKNAILNIILKGKKVQTRNHKIRLPAIQLTYKKRLRQKNKLSSCDQATNTIYIRTILQRQCLHKLQGCGVKLISQLRLQNDASKNIAVVLCLTINVSVSKLQICYYSRH